MLNFDLFCELTLYVLLLTKVLILLGLVAPVHHLHHPLPQDLHTPGGPGKQRLCEYKWKTTSVKYLCPNLREWLSIL